MINTQVIKVSKRIAIIFLIAVFSIAGIVACGNAENISGSSSGGFVQVPEIPDNGKTGPLTTDLPSFGLDYRADITPTTPDQPDQPTTPTFPDNTKYEIYAPFITSQGNYIQVSYLDTNSLNDMWKKHVARAGSNDNIKWIMRDGDNRSKNPKDGNYYYFDKNADIVHAGNYANGIKLKEFVGGVIIKYNQDWTGAISDVYTIGGLYKTLLNKDNNNSEGRQGYNKHNNNNLNEFMRANHNLEEGDLSIILMNVGYATVDDRYDFMFSYEFGVDQYYSTTDNNYRKNASYFIGKNPSEYYAKLNAKVNHSGDLNKFNFRFTMAEAENWWLNLAQ